MKSLKHAAPATTLVVALLFTPTPSLAARIQGNCYPTPVRIGVVNEGASDAALVSNANIEWVRMTIRWSEVQPGPAMWNWASVDDRVNTYYARGQKILAILSTAPQWAGSNANGTRPVGTIQNTGLWEEFVRRVAARYAGRIVAYEIWNEPDLDDVDIGVGWTGPLFNLGQPNQLPYYAQYVIKASQQIRANAPGTLVVAPATRSQPASKTVDVYRSLQQYGVAAHMDVVSFHANGFSGDSSNVIWSRINSHLNTLRARNPANLNKPVWITEFGWATAHNSPELQRDKIRAIATRWTMGTFGANCSENQDAKSFLAFIHNLHDGPGFTRGIHWENSSPKPVVTSYLRTLPTWAIQLPDGAPLPYVPFTFGCSGRTCTFTSGHSSEPGRFFDWDFGDGTTAGGRTVTHTYAKSGHYHIFHGTFVETGPTPDFVSSLQNWQSDARFIQVP